MAREMMPSKWSPNPFSFGGTSLPLPLLLAAKLVALCLLLRFTWRNLPSPFLPFLSVLDYFRYTPLFAWTLKMAVLIGCAAVLLNYRVRTACLVTGSAFFLGILASRPYFENNILYLACLLILLGLYEPRTGPWLIRAQIILVFFAAALNKLLDTSWRSGQFFDYWASVFVNKSFYFQVESWLPQMALARLMSWTTIAIEFGIAVTLLFRRSRIWGVWLGLLLAAGQNFLTERTFGVFFYVMPISYLAFFAWPPSGITVHYDVDCGFCRRIHGLVGRLDVDRLFAWRAFKRGVDLSEIPRDRHTRRLYAIIGEKKYSGFAALRIIALYFPIVYFALLVPLTLPQGLLLHHRSLLPLFFLLFFSPIFAKSTKLQNSPAPAESLGNRLQLAS